MLIDCGDVISLPKNMLPLRFCCDKLLVIQGLEKRSTIIDSTSVYLPLSGVLCLQRGH